MTYRGDGDGDDDDLFVFKSDHVALQATVVININNDID